MDTAERAARSIAGVRAVGLAASVVAQGGAAREKVPILGVRGGAVAVTLRGLPGPLPIGAGISRLLRPRAP